MATVGGLQGECRTKQVLGIRRALLSDGLPPH